MQKIDVVDLLEGMVIDEDIYEANGVLVIAKGMSLKKVHIEYIQYESDYVQVRILKKETEETSEISSKKETQLSKYEREKIRFNEGYNESVKRFKSLFKAAKLGGKILYEDVENVVKPLLKEVESCQDISQKIWQIRQSDEYTFEHSVQVSLYAALCGNWLAMSPQEIKDLSIAGLLHDVGKCNVPNEILNKPGALTKKEFEIMRTHSTLGYILLANTNRYNQAILSAVLQHHERNDGSGYPHGLKGDEIHPYARIVAIGDVYSAMTSERVYHKADSPFLVAGELQKKSFGSLDSFYTKIFVENVVQYFVGCQVILNTGERGEIIFIDKNYPSQPLVKTISGVVNLAENDQRYISDVLKD